MGEGWLSLQATSEVTSLSFSVSHSVSQNERQKSQKIVASFKNDSGEKSIKYKKENNI